MRPRHPELTRTKTDSNRPRQSHLSDSNRRPATYEIAALPSELRGHVVRPTLAVPCSPSGPLLLIDGGFENSFLRVGILVPSEPLRGIEPPTTRLQGGGSATELQRHGADDEIRTRDPNLGKVMRYHCATSARCPEPAATGFGPHDPQSATSGRWRVTAPGREHRAAWGNRTPLSSLED